MKPKRNFTLERKNKKRVCPKCEGEPVLLGIDGSFVLHCKCKECGHEFTGHEGKEVSE